MQDTTDLVAAEAEPEFVHEYRLGAKLVKFVLSDIVALYASHKYVEVVLRNETIRPLWGWSLVELMADERFKHDFIYVHRSTLVRLSAVSTVGREPASAKYFVIIDCAQVPAHSTHIRFDVSRRYYSPTKRAVADTQYALRMARSLDLPGLPAHTPTL